MRAVLVARLVTGMMAVVAVVGAGASATASASPKPASAKRTAAEQFVRDSAPVEKASARFEAKAMSWFEDPSLTNAQAESAARPMVTALELFRRELGAQRWPAGTNHDISNFASACGTLVRDLKALSHDDMAKSSSWEGPLLHDDLATTAAANKVRRDLGLRPVTVL
jgi:hypothetical protein